MFRQRCWFRPLVIALAAALAQPGLLGAATFTGLSDLPGGSFYSQA